MKISPISTLTPNCLVMNSIAKGGSPYVHCYQKHIEPQRQKQKENKLHSTQYHFSLKSSGQGKNGSCFLTKNVGMHYKDKNCNLRC